MSSTTGAILILVAGLGSMGYVTYRSVSSGKQTAQEVRQELRQERTPVHVRFIIHRTEPELRQALMQLKVEYRPEALSTKVAISETLCEVHVINKSTTDLPPPDEFIAEQVGECREMVANFKGKTVAY